MSGEGVRNPANLTSIAVFYLKKMNGELLLTRSFNSYPPPGFVEILNIYYEDDYQELIFIT